ncbi:MAG: tyrosine protein phosphatase [Gemmataceae bacterium]
MDIVVSALTEEEIETFDLSAEATVTQANGIRYLPFPIPDREAPTLFKVAGQFIHELEAKLTSGQNVAIHCRQSIGRASLLAAGLLVASGTDATAAFKRIERARGCPVPETVEQREWVAKLARDIMKPTEAS